ncbi:MAG: hypothetical protein MMC33_007399 [Icmadophila ericetorum]|nr:hypothetical protein [Icmadophila ericetorum]
MRPRVIDSPGSDSPTGSEYEPDISIPQKTRPAPKRTAKDDPHLPQLEAPMSQFFESSDNGKPVKDIFDHVHRSAESRRGVGRRTDEKIKRPMNAFMLYRKAYAEAVAKYMNKNNHQAISKILGASWRLEPKNIKEIYQQYAEIDKANHQIAFPDYVFQPKKGKKAVVKRKGKPSESKSIEADDSPTFGYHPNLDEGSRTGSHSIRGEEVYLDPLMPERMDWPNLDPVVNRSAFEISNPGRQPAVQHGQFDTYSGQYYGQAPYPAMYGSSYSEHNMYQSTHGPGNNRNIGPYGINNLPDTYQANQFYGVSTTPDHRHLDPSLFSTNDTTNRGAGLISQQGFDDFGNESILHNQNQGIGSIYSPIRFDQLSSAFDFRQDLTKGATEEETEHSGN